MLKWPSRSQRPWASVKPNLTIHSKQPACVGRKVDCRQHLLINISLGWALRLSSKPSTNPLARLCSDFWFGASWCTCSACVSMLYTRIAGFRVSTALNIFEWQIYNPFISNCGKNEGYCGVTMQKHWQFYGRSYIKKQCDKSTHNCNVRVGWCTWASFQTAAWSAEPFCTAHHVRQNTHHASRHMR